jgi:hypothetical protein
MISRRELDQLLAIFEAAGFDAEMIAAYEAAIPLWAADPSIRGVALGMRERGGELVDEGVIRFMVRRKKGWEELSPEQIIPSYIQGVPTDVVQANYRKQSGARFPRGEARSTMQPGLSISTRGGTAGTLGCIATNGQSVCLVSAAHVLYERSSGSSDGIMQPGRVDGSGREVAVATKRDARTDVGYAVLLDGLKWDRIPLEGKWPLVGPVLPQWKQVLEMSGRSGIVAGFVDGIGPADGGRFQMSIACQGSTEFGDSGAPWYDPESGALVGLQTKIRTRNGRSVLAALAFYAFERLGLRL